MDKKYCQASVLEIEGEKLFVASDETLDRHGEIISVDGWDIKNFKNNPTILWAHDGYYPKIGNATKIGFKTVNGKKSLVFEPEFHRKDQLSNLVADLVEEGWIKTVSVGFMANKTEENVITESELLEISFVNVPANPSAMQLMFAKGYDRETVKQVMPEMEKLEKEIELQKVKEENEALKKSNEELENKIKSLPEVKPQSGDQGRELASVSNLTIKRRVTIKVLNKALEVLNKLEKEKKC